MKDLNLSIKPKLYSLALALLTLTSISLVGCGNDQGAMVDSQEPEIYRRDNELEASPSPSAPPHVPFPDFYGNGPGKEFYGH
jgi:hypothetical protein